MARLVAGALESPCSFPADARLRATVGLSRLTPIPSRLAAASVGAPSEGARQASGSPVEAIGAARQLAGTAK